MRLDALSQLSQIIVAEADATDEATLILCRMLKPDAERAARKQPTYLDCTQEIEK